MPTGVYIIGFLYIILHINALCTLLWRFVAFLSAFSSYKEISFQISTQKRGCCTSLCATAPPGCILLFFLAVSHKLFQFIKKAFHIRKLAVDRCKADIGHLVDLF